ncbi:mandelate racemase/muconate lactonizing enzyme family protein [Arachidicoccus soli]|uniref:Dipeptide epimerase n=1 Tax=Arachidicoccus soli TaxID=2341117 RepID=A0A386HT60_9BACT|nr:dipeptide epimerase [Arachidicoccus soli]AYD48590.1 dipeptide epimerase [Arachidicoccus soli]
MQFAHLFIQQVEIYQSPIKLKEPFVISLGAFHYAENIVIIIRTKEGVVGFGECSPFMSINGESLETCYVVAQYLAKILIGKNALDIEDCSLSMNKVIYSNNSIKSAFDMALYDIAAQNAMQPLYAFLGGNKNKTLFTDYTVSIGEAKKMARDALKIKEQGFQVIKIKLGHSGEKDVERIKLIRDAIGMEIPLRIDANQGWEVDEAIYTLEALGKYNIQHAEEPIARWDYMQLPAIKKKSPIKIMADESCCDHHDAKRLIDLEACDYFNIKLGKSSGIFDALKIIKLAEARAIKIQVGGFLESRLAFTAAAHLALVSEQIIHCDFDTPLMFVEDPVEGGITYSNKGVISIPETAGLGATMSEKYLNKLAKIILR